MTKKEECFKLFSENDYKDREYVINLAISKLGVTKATAQTYYPAWRNVYTGKPCYASRSKKENQEELKNITEVADKSHKPKIDGVNIEKIVSDAFAKTKKELLEKREKDITENTKDAAKITESKGINWKAETIKPIEELFEVKRLVPVVMQGIHGLYNFSKNGVYSTPQEGFISKERTDEALEAYEIWERCYGGSNAEKNMS
jgi:hypothetical protein